MQYYIINIYPKIIRIHTLCRGAMRSADIAKQVKPCYQSFAGDNEIVSFASVICQKPSANDSDSRSMNDEFVDRPNTPSG